MTDTVKHFEVIETVEFVDVAHEYTREQLRELDIFRTYTDNRLNEHLYDACAEQDEDEPWTPLQAEFQARARATVEAHSPDAAYIRLIPR